MKLFLSLVLLFLAGLHCHSQTPNASSLKLPELMKGDDFIGHQPFGHSWTYENTILFHWNPKKEPQASEYNYALNEKKYTCLPVDHSFHADNTLGTEPVEYFLDGGNIYTYNRKTAKTTCLIQTSAPLYNLQQFKGNEVLFFEQEGKLMSYKPSTGTWMEVIRFSKGKKPAENAPITHWEREELALFKFHQEEKAAKEWKDAHQSAKKIPSINFDCDGVSNVQINGTARFITFREDYYPNNPSTHVEHHISADGHTYIQNARAKVSDLDPHHKLGIYDLQNDSLYYADFSELPGIRSIPAYRRAIYGDTTELTKDRNIIMHAIVYSEDGMQNVMDIRSYDNKDRWIVSLNLATGKLTVLDHQHDDAWIGGPGISGWNMVPGTLGFIDNNRVYFQSEESGYSHLYLYQLSTRTKTALTEGKWEVHGVQLSAKKDKFYLTANKRHPGNREIYHLIIASKQLIPVLITDGNHEVVVSPDEKMLAVRFSTATLPWELYLVENKPGSTPVRITHSTTPEFDSYTWHNPSVITFESTAKTPVYARLYTPTSDAKNGAAVIFVHGAGYLQNAHNYWSSYHREYMFHNLLRDNGYTVLDIDYRASEGYGRDHRTAIYRHMGGADLQDQLSGRQLLIDSLGIDENRIGIYGGSYGGFITLMALLTEPGKFKCGAALRSVTDWFHYNHEYTSNILNYPSSDPEAYKKSAPIYYADNLQDKLLMLHGMVDDNVQFQDVVRLSQRFIELGKDNWELAVFPVEAHSFVKSYSWADEYRRIYELFYEELILNQ